jgi:hypothetical protein
VEAIANGCTSMFPYEPIFGYRLKSFIPYLRIVPGATDYKSDGFYNLNYPPAMSEFPLLLDNGFPRIPASDALDFELFVTHRMPHWPLSAAQRAACDISVTALLACLMLFFFSPAVLFRRLKA